VSSDVTVGVRLEQPDVPDVDVTAVLGPLTLANPILTASGCAAAGRELAAFIDPASLGAIVTKSVMLKARSGRPTPRMAETPSGMLNGIGLQGAGVDELASSDLPWLADVGAVAIVSVAGESVEEFAKVTARLRGAAAMVAIEVNSSCPNGAADQRSFARDPKAAAAVVTGVRRAVAPGTPIFAKLAPDVTDIVEMAEAVVGAGADGITLVNTLTGMAIDRRTLRPVLSGRTGGLSGPAIRAVALRCVYDVHAAFPDVPLIGVGGIATIDDVLAFVAAGASAVQIGTMLFAEPDLPHKLLSELPFALAEHGVQSLTDLVGVAHHREGT
jgi:dihydroorotate dehydrogenase (NAD+) catalytic subunit